MLIEFRVENHRSIREEQILTLVAGRVGEPADPRAREVEGHGERLLPVAALYGANASGKSNVLDALTSMRGAVVYSHRSWGPDWGVPRTPFAWGPHRSRPSLFEVTFLAGGVRFEYGFAADNKTFVEEWLYAFPRGRKQVWFEREGQDFKFGENLGGDNRVVADVTRPNALFLSAAAQLGHPALADVYRWFEAMSCERSAEPTQGAPAGGAWRTFAPLDFGGSVETRTADPQLLALLQSADVGIVDVRIEERKSPDTAGGFMFVPPMIHTRVYMRHMGAEDDVWLPLEAESHGTQTLFHEGPRMLRALQVGGLLLVDELEKSLHPLLALQIVRLFNDPRSNPRNAQLVFTTHDTSLLGTILGEPALRRDQVWLTEKNLEGATQLYPLTDYQPRKQENVERGYLQGRYGAIPFLGALAPVPH